MSIKDKFASLGFDSFVNSQRAADERIAALEATNRAAKEEALLKGHQAELASVQAQGAEAASAAFTAGAVLAAGAIIFGLFLKEEKRKEQAAHVAHLEREAQAAAREAHRQAQVDERERLQFEREQAAEAVRALELEVRRREAQARLDTLDKRENNNKA